MAQPSTTRNFFGRAIDRILPGSNYNPQTGQYSNIGKGVAGLGARMAATALLGPAAGVLVGKGADMLINHSDNRIGGVVPEGIPTTSNFNAGGQPIAINAGMAPTMSLGLGGSSPSWGGYMQGAGSMNNFGNQQFGNGMTTQAGSWSPSSQWGADLAGGGQFGMQLGNNLGAMTGAPQAAAPRQARFGTGASNEPVSNLGMSARGGVIGFKSPHERNQYTYRN